MAQTKLKNYQFDKSDYANAGRLTLISGSPIVPYDVTSANTVYYTPYNGNIISLYSGTEWVNVTFTEKSLSLVTSASTANKNYDIFASYSTGSIVLNSQIWSNDTTRITSLSCVNGIYANSSNYDRYLGTIRTFVAGSTCDIAGGSDLSGSRLIWNYNNRIEKYFSCFQSTTSWQYGSTTWRGANGNAFYRISFVTGMSENLVSVDYAVLCSSGSNNSARIGFGMDDTTTNALLPNMRVSNINGTGVTLFTLNNTYSVLPSAGFHYIQAIERSVAVDGGATFFGGYGADVTLAIFKGKTWG